MSQWVTDKHSQWSDSGPIKMIWVLFWDWELLSVTVWVGMKGTNRCTICKCLILGIQGREIWMTVNEIRTYPWVYFCLLVLNNDICLDGEYWILQAQNADILWSMYIGMWLSSKKDKSFFLDTVRNAFMQPMSKRLNLSIFSIIFDWCQFEMKEIWTQEWKKLDPLWNLWGCYSCAITFKVTCKWTL